MKKLISILISLSLLYLTGNNWVLAQDVPVGSYIGSYYTGKNFDNLVFTRNDSNIDFIWQWKGPDPKIGKNNFSIRWQGKFNFDNWLYEFTANSDDGIKVYLDGELIINEWHNSSFQGYKARRQLSSGLHTIVTEYYQDQIYSGVRLSWAKVMPTVTVSPGGNQQVPTGGYQGAGASDLYTSSCVELSIDPEEGTPPLTVQFTGAGYDPYGAVQKYKFDFADASDGQGRLVEEEDYIASHIYKTPGTYKVSLQIQDSKGVWRTSDKCKGTITVTGGALDGIGGGGDIPTATVSSLPKTGRADNLLFSSVVILGFGSFGLYLLKRFRQV